MLASIRETGHRTEADGSGYTVYFVCGDAEDGRTWQLERRFSEFVDLREALIDTGCAVVATDF